ELLYILAGGRGIEALPPDWREKILEKLSQMGHRKLDPLERLFVPEALPLDDIYYYEADAAAMRLLISMGVPVEQSYAFLQKLLDAQQRYRDYMPYLERGGPSLENRLGSAQAYAKTLPKISAVAGSSGQLLPVQSSSAEAVSPITTN
ncbi:MAG TPA: hypothetical protein PLL10_08840, partial [Elusimicrobiales bacterium]|nr:hypothetical protein [Elusimicrobiales bacterium]